MHFAQLYLGPGAWVKSYNGGNGRHRENLPENKHFMTLHNFLLDK